ncbi:hypothetical protein MIND_01193200 [Mycena indigotica]|uniref:Uncharacterized protein n=1 Tax=Mycena indigotica TaxID=2126181 RepID=A0A8H6S4D5_9AGAR|nr:uncharacterized protein MIND_01193200 [Mycena indigotica]KAF7292940.1 hypothetical protein MIND_01193200 [Mycena indigotica]
MLSKLVHFFYALRDLYARVRHGWNTLCYIQAPLRVPRSTLSPVMDLFLFPPPTDRHGRLLGPASANDAGQLLEMMIAVGDACSSLHVSRIEHFAAGPGGSEFLVVRFRDVDADGVTSFMIIEGMEGRPDAQGLAPEHVLVSRSRLDTDVYVIKPGAARLATVDVALTLAQVLTLARSVPGPVGGLSYVRVLLCLVHRVMGCDDNNTLVDLSEMEAAFRACFTHLMGRVVEVRT